MSGPGQVRIIAGRWRGSRLPILDVPGLRPTSDRVRETLFNWLAPVLPGARCVDLFAGTGALGLEAASRGAASVQLIESQPQVAQQLKANVERLRGEQIEVTQIEVTQIEVIQIEVIQADALSWLKSVESGRIDIAFVDPPFDSELWRPLLAELLPRLAPAARVYLETPTGALSQLPAGFSLLRHGKTREVDYRLLQAV
jgi:16S rRNA (guanine966-N2)-methyltransferase